MSQNNYLKNGDKPNTTFINTFTEIMVYIDNKKREY